MNVESLEGQWPFDANRPAAGVLRLVVSSLSLKRDRPIRRRQLATYQVDQDGLVLSMFTGSAGRDPPALRHRECQLADGGASMVSEQEEPSPELKEFIDQLIVPLLVERLLAETGHLYSAGGSQVRY